MAGTNGDADMSSSARNAGFKLLWGECVFSPHESLPTRAPLCRGGGCLGGEKLFVDSDCTELCQPIETFGTSPLWVVVSERGQIRAAFRRVAFSWHKEALVVRKEANCCW